MLINIDTFHYASIIASIPSKRFYNNKWLKIHPNHCFQVKHKNNNSIIIGDSIVTGLTRHTNIRENNFGDRFNLDISRDRAENVLWRAKHIPSLKKYCYTLLYK